MSKGQDILDILATSTPVKGAAVTADREHTADPSLDVLVARLKALEQQVQLQRQLINSLQGAAPEASQTLLEGKEASVQGLEAALEQLQSIREAEPPDPDVTRAVLASLHEDLQKKQARKRERFRGVLRDAKRVGVTNTTGQPQVLTINGISVVLQPGENTVPEPFAAAWGEHLEMVQIALERDLAIRGSVDFGVLENWIAAGQEIPLELASDRMWSEE